MRAVGELFGFPIYTSPSLPPGEVAIIGTGEGLEVDVEDGSVVLRRRIVAVKIVGLEEGGTNQTGSVPRPAAEQLELL